MPYGQSKYGKWQNLYNLNKGAAQEERDTNIAKQEQAAGTAAASAQQNAQNSLNKGQYSGYAQDGFSTGVTDAQKKEMADKAASDASGAVSGNMKDIDSAKEQVSVYGDRSKFADKMKEQNKSITDNQAALSAWYSGVSGSNPIVNAMSSKFDNIKNSIGESINSGASAVANRGAENFGRQQTTDFLENARKNYGLGTNTPTAGDVSAVVQSSPSWLAAKKYFEGKFKNQMGLGSGAVGPLTDDTGAASFSMAQQAIQSLASGKSPDGRPMTFDQSLSKLKDAMFSLNDDAAALSQDLQNVDASSPESQSKREKLNRLNGVIFELNRLLNRGGR